MKIRASEVRPLDNITWEGEKYVVQTVTLSERDSQVTLVAAKSRWANNGIKIGFRYQTEVEVSRKEKK